LRFTPATLLYFHDGILHAPLSPQPEGYAASFPLRALPSGRRLAAARTGVSDCAGFAPNQPQPRLALTALSLAPCHPPSHSVLFFSPSHLFSSRCRFSEVRKQTGILSFLVRSKTDPKTVQALLRHSDVKTTLQLYAHSVSTDRMTAQGEVLQAILASKSALCGLKRFC